MTVEESFREISLLGCLLSENVDTECDWAVVRVQGGEIVSIGEASMAKYQIKQHSRPWGKRYTIALIADNGEATGDVYTTLEHAIEGVVSAHSAALEAKVMILPDGRSKEITSEGHIDES